MTEASCLGRTSGWSYPSWRPGFYPAGLANEEFLRFYSQRLPSVELNSTGYRLPAEEQFERWAAQVPAGFSFAVKMPPRSLRSLGTFEERVRRLGERLGPVRVVVERPRDDGLLALLLGSTGLAPRTRPARRELGRRRCGAGGSCERLGRGFGVPLSPLPRAAVHRRAARGAGGTDPDARGRRGSRYSRTSGTRTSRRRPDTQCGCSNCYSNADTGRELANTARLGGVKSRARTSGASHLSYRS